MPKRFTDATEKLDKVIYQIIEKDGKFSSKPVEHVRRFVAGRYHSLYARRESLPAAFFGICGLAITLADMGERSC